MIAAHAITQSDLVFALIILGVIFLLLLIIGKLPWSR